MNARLAVVASVGLFVGLTLLAPRRAAAAPDARAAAQRLAAGAAALQDGDLPRAVSELGASIAAKPTTRALLLLAGAHIKLGQLEPARAALDQARALKGARRAAIDQLIAQIDLLKRTRLVISSTPSGATVYIDSRAEGARGTTPLTLPVLPGPHRVLLELEGHRAAAQTAVAVEGSDVAVSQALEPRRCALAVEAVAPTGAGPVEVRLDGAAAGALPLAATVPAGEHRLAFAGPGLAGVVRAILCADERPISIREHLELQPLGRVRVHGPAGARLDIDGAAQALDQDISLPAGAHRVGVVTAGGQRWSTEVQVAAGVGAELTAQLPAGPPSLAVTVEPASARLLVDGRQVPTGTPVELTPGRRALEVSAPGFVPVETAFDLAPAQATRLALRLRPVTAGRGTPALCVALASLGLALGAESLALAGHFSAEREQVGTRALSEWQGVEIGGHVVAAVLAGIAVATGVVAIVQRRAR